MLLRPMICNTIIHWRSRPISDTAIRIYDTSNRPKAAPKSMAQMKPPSLLPFFLLFLLITAPSASSFHVPFSGYKSAVSLSHSLLTRVSNLRASRGDTDGAKRAKLLADKLERCLGLGFWRMAWSFGWDYARNYAWRRDFDYRELYGAVSDLNELARVISGYTRAESNVERAAWVARNYKNVLGASTSVLNQLYNVFRQSGPLKEVIETVRKEMVDGDLLRDCLELGSNDLKGLVLIVKDLASQFYAPSSHSGNDDL